MKKIFILMVITAMVLSGCTVLASSGLDKMLGNTNSNIVNGGLVVQDGSDIYYADFRQGIIKTDKSLEKIEIIESTTPPSHIRVIGDRVYAKLNGEIYRFKKDGREKEKITKADYFINDSNQWMYTAVSNSDNSEDIGIYKIDLDTKETIKLSSDFVTNGLSFDGQWLYYLNRSIDGRIYRMRSDGSQRESISNTSINSMTVEGDWIYHGYGAVFKMKKDGSQVSEVININDEDKVHVIQFINVYKGWIYISAHDPESKINKIIKFKTNGSNKTVLAEETKEIAGICVVDDYLYYASTNGSLYRIETRGGEPEIISRTHP